MTFLTLLAELLKGVKAGKKTAELLKRLESLTAKNLELNTYIKRAHLNKYVLPELINDKILKNASKYTLNQQLILLKKKAEQKTKGKVFDPVKIASYFHKTPTQLLMDIIVNPSKISEELGKLSPQERKEISILINSKAQEEGVDASLLSSSWIQSGVYVPVGIGLSGDLTITTLPTKNSPSRDYTYPGVALSTWEAMKAAKGKNGSGAGSVFWFLYLRVFEAGRPKVKMV